MMRAPENKAATATSGAETCPYCGRALSRGLCRQERLGFFCWAEGLQVNPENIHLPDDTTPEHVRRARERFDGQIEKAVARDSEAAEIAELADLAWWEAIQAKNALADSDAIFINQIGELVPTNAKMEAQLSELKKRIARSLIAREDAFEALKRVRVELHRLQMERTAAGCRADACGPGVVDKLRDAIGL